jgi:hypothetical protein
MKKIHFSFVALLVISTSLFGARQQSMLLVRITLRKKCTLKCEMGIISQSVIYNAKDHSLKINLNNNATLTPLQL